MFALIDNCLSNWEETWFTFVVELWYIKKSLEPPNLNCSLSDNKHVASITTNPLK